MVRSQALKKPSKQEIDDAFMKALKNRKELVRKDIKKKQETALLHQTLLNGQLITVPQEEHVEEEQYVYDSQPLTADDDQENLTEDQSTAYYPDNSQDIFESQQVFGAS